MDLSNFINFLQILHIVTLYTCINADKTVTISEEDEQLARKEEINRLKILGIDEPELFYNLTHPNNFPKNCTNLIQKMRQLYKPTLDSYTRRIWFRQIFKQTKNFYTNSNLSSTVRFEDYFAIKYFTVKGYVEMMNDTDISRRMKNALYNVAITQANDPNEKFNSTLFKGYTNLTIWYKEQFNETRKKLEWNDFVKVETTHKGAEFIAESQKLMDVFNVETEGIYEMYFPKKYLRVNLKDFDINNLFVNSVLLPETKFFINETIWNSVNATHERLTIKMTHNDENVKLFDQQKNVMNKLKKLHETGTQFYVC